MLGVEGTGVTGQDPDAVLFERDATVFVHRSVLRILVFTALTFGLYALYWFYSVSRQYRRYLEADYSPALRTLGLLVPLVNLVVVWRQAVDAGEADPELDPAILFLAALVFFPIAMYLVQSSINDLVPEV